MAGWGLVQQSAIRRNRTMVDPHAITLADPEGATVRLGQLTDDLLVVILVRYFG